MPHNTQKQKARSKETAEEVPPQGFHQHLGNLLEVQLKHLSAVDRLSAPAPSLPLQTSHLIFKSPPAVVFHSTPCQFHTILSLSATRFHWFPLPPLQAVFVALRSFNLPCLKPPSLPSRAALWVWEPFRGRQILPSWSGTQHGNALLTAHRRFYL